jgi:hypothetical protein
LRFGSGSIWCNAPFQKQCALLVSFLSCWNPTLIRIGFFKISAPLDAHFRPPNQEELQEDEDGYGNNVERQQIRIETIGAAEDMDDLPDY